MTRLLHISDLHFGTEQPHVMAALLALGRLKKPDVLIVSGDITQRATPSEFARAKAFCDQLEVPTLLALPGNHDIPLFNVFARAFWPYAAFQKAFGQALEQHFQTPSLCISLVNTTRPWRHKNGEISAAQIERVCREQASATPQQLRVVVVHQPVHVLRPQDEHDRLIGWQPALKAWSAAGADMVLGGHIHLPYVCELSAMMSGLSRRLWCVQAGTAVSSRIRREAPNSINLIEFLRGGSDSESGNKFHCTVERWDHQNTQTLLAGSANRSGSGKPGAGEFALAHTSALNIQRD